MKNRPEYRRRANSTVWHFRTECRWWPQIKQTAHGAGFPKKPPSGTLCDHCQAIEKKKEKKP